MGLEHLKSEHQKQVEKTKRYANQELRDSPGEPSDKTKELQARLIIEEALETVREGLGVTPYFVHHQKDGTILTIPLSAELINLSCNPGWKGYRPLRFDLIKLIDGCCDLKVVTTGTLSACGVPDEPFQKEVDENNLTKFPGGKALLREDGKYLKPPGYKPPDFQGVLNQITTKSDWIGEFPKEKAASDNNCMVWWVVDVAVKGGQIESWRIQAVSEESASHIAVTKMLEGIQFNKPNEEYPKAYHNLRKITIAKRYEKSTSKADDRSST